MRVIMIGLGVACLAGCSVPVPEQEKAASDQEKATSDQEKATSDQDKVMRDERTAPFNAVQPASQARAGASSRIAPIASDNRLPAAFVGRWGLVPADCTSIGGDAKGLMTVEADRLTFYESRASVTKAEAVSPTELRVTLAFSGEVQDWTQNTPLVLADNGNALTRFADGQTLRYTRCGA